MARHFFIIGAQRSGTTLLYSLLEDHPEVSMARPLRPEPKYFIRTDSEDIDHNAYMEKYFSHYKDEKWCGEKSTSYYEMGSIAQKIYAFDPEAKIIFVARHPGYRAISNFYFSRQNGLETRSIQDVFLNDVTPPNFNAKVSVNPFHYIERGYYFNLLQPYINLFDRKNILVLLFEELIQSVNLNTLWQFLDIEDPGYNDALRVVNPSSKESSEYLIEILHKLNHLYLSSNQKLSDLFNLDLSIWRS